MANLMMNVSLPAPSLSIGAPVVHYQPQVDMRTESICGLEALVRWDDPVLGILQPAEFLPLIEDSFMMKWLTATVTTEVLGQLARWNARGIAASVSINFDPDTLEDADFIQWMTHQLQWQRIEPSRVTIEITEGALLDREGAIPVLHALRALGIGLSMDDFGTGYSCLHRLRDLPLTEVKIDKSFIERAAVDPRTGRIVEVMVELAHDLGITVVAEGIETERARWAALGAACDKGQGYLFGRPMPPGEIERLLAHSRHDG